ncbi:MAG: hypothetical protein EH225_08510 [Calditrichaeota bacterium]|nr:hypothetical protein [Calditrichota bacterium]RQW02412.1 MAG: hypothetical protein EH225_08510 [Calditrichota bacterium]
MFRVPLAVVISGLFVQISAQTTITFRLNMQSLIDSNLFVPALGEKVVVRGNFNDWKGYNYELRSEDNSLFENIFIINAKLGDTLEYKFVIQNRHDRDYWERNPNPDNSNHGNRKLLINGTNLILPITTFDYDEYIRYPVMFSKEKLQKDFLQMREALEENHPALYDYTDKKIIDSLFIHHYERLDTAIELGDFYENVQSVLSSIGCGHTKLWIPSHYWNIVPKRLFPLKLHFINKRVYVSGFHNSTRGVPLGSEIIAINHIPVQGIIDTLKSITSSDGFIDAFRSKIVEKHFSEKYALCYGYPEIFHVSYIAPGDSAVTEAEIAPVDIETVQQSTARGSELSLKVLEENRTAVLTINTFIYYDRLEFFRSFVDSAFEAIKKNNILNLVLDLRGNDGGDPFCSSYLLSYIENEPVPYFAELYGRYDSLARPIPLAENNFRGNLYILIDGNCFSTTGHFTALLKYYQIGTLVGTETGATYTCTGSVEYIDLKNTRLILGTAKKRRYSVAVQGMDPQRGVLPDYHVEQSQHDIIQGRDTILEFVLQLIASHHAK